MLKIILPAIALTLAGAAQAQAQSRHLTATGASLEIDSPCARQVSVTPDPALNNRIEVDATAGNQDELAQLAFDSGTTAKLHGPAVECWRPGSRESFTPTLVLAIRIPPAMAVAIDESGAAHYQLGAVGKLALNISGAVHLQAERAETATIDVSGKADIGIGQLDGDLATEISGAGDVHVDHGTMKRLTLNLSGHGGFKLGSGDVGRLTLDLSGAGDADVGATIGDATVTVSGAGDVRLAKVTGRLMKEVDGMGSVTVGE
jgi:hypothetical protein